MRIWTPGPPAIRKHKGAEMAAAVHFVSRSLPSTAIALVILPLLLPCSATTNGQAQPAKPPAPDPAHLVFETVAGNYGNLYNIIQDKDGFLWLAGSDGALRYNGYEAEKIYPGETVSAMLQDSEGLIWMVVRSGVAAYDKRTGQTTMYFINPNDPTALSGESQVAFQKTQLLAEDKDGAIWIATQAGLNKFDKKGSKFTAYRSKATVSKTRWAGSGAGGLAGWA